MMKVLLSGLAISLGALATNVSSQIMLEVNGVEYSLTSLMENCQSMDADPVAQIACFSAVSNLMEGQNAPEATTSVGVAEAFEALRVAAEYQDADTGLLINGSECNIEILYFGNYYHISRRNESSLDVFSAQFDASNFDNDKTTGIQGGGVPLSRGHMNDGTTATTAGGIELASSQYNFEAKTARATVQEYAIEVVGQLDTNESSEFDFVLVHQAKSGSSTQIWNAFENYVNACQG